jgi:AGZA family xanthine/uracil permease-like MFS transporter
VDGVSSIIGALTGNPVPTAVYIGHPGWKSVGARLGYALANGICVLAITLLGIVPLMLYVIPLPAILPILIYIGIVITTQAFAHVSPRHYPAVAVAILPCLADWGRTLVNGGISVAGGNASVIPPETFASSGVFYAGMSGLAQGAIVIGILWGTMVVFMIERKSTNTIITMLVAAAMSFFGIIHSGEVGLLRAPGAVVGYLLAAGVVLAMGKFDYEDGEMLHAGGTGEQA